MGMVQQNQKAVKVVPEEEEGLLVGHLTQNNPVGIQDLILAKASERGATWIALEMNSRRLNLLRLTVR